MRAVLCRLKHLHPGIAVEPIQHLHVDTVAQTKLERAFFELLRSHLHLRERLALVELNQALADGKYAIALVQDDVRVGAVVGADERARFQQQLGAHLKLYGSVLGNTLWRDVLELSRKALAVDGAYR